jgi:hypothetical protein
MKFEAQKLIIADAVELLLAGGRRVAVSIIIRTGAHPGRVPRH